MKQDLTEIVCVIDRSGSMQSICSDAIGGFNAFLEAQKKVPGQAILSLILFNDEDVLVRNRVDIDDVVPLTSMGYVPQGQTALLDALGRAITKTGSDLEAIPEADRPCKVLFCILTDGQENASREYNRFKIKEMIEHQRQKYSWEFVFLAANQDAFAAASTYGINTKMARCFTADAIGTQRAYADMSALATSYRANP